MFYGCSSAKIGHFGRFFTRNFFPNCPILTGLEPEESYLNLLFSGI